MGLYNCKVKCVLYGNAGDAADSIRPTEDAAAAECALIGSGEIEKLENEKA